MRAARKRLHIAVYVFCLILMAKTTSETPAIEVFAVKAWNKIYDEARVHRIRRRLGVWIPIIIERLFDGPIFHVKYVSYCTLHHPSTSNDCGCYYACLRVGFSWFLFCLFYLFSLRCAFSVFGFCKGVGVLFCGSVLFAK